jgi:hypothetical protein
VVLRFHGKARGNYLYDLGKNSLGTLESIHWCNGRHTGKVYAIRHGVNPGYGESLGVSTEYSVVIGPFA